MIAGPPHCAEQGSHRSLAAKTQFLGVQTTFQSREIVPSGPQRSLLQLRIRIGCICKQRVEIAGKCLGIRAEIGRKLCVFL
ncbi:hypothetical protein Bresa_01021|uniref:Uncharacterized protein n=1 Tax=Brenneria salicis ATCC 15712 = DSM 30166 TaxID=714314 RepID=A0A366HYP3_9GAMM|nr:hypothetical protein [Brenneria salicis ATCC 15712 = DSM 30166]RBP57618.1 hypothetical protein DES54_16211 [Brenneria salicis ATCC 15712 = DSM 30166]